MRRSIGSHRSRRGPSGGGFIEGWSFAQAAALDRTTPDVVRKREAAAMQELRRKESAHLRAFLDERTPFYSVHGVHGVERLVVKRERLVKTD